MKSESIKVETSKISKNIQDVLADLTFPVRTFAAEHYSIHFVVDGVVHRVFKPHVDAKTKKLICDKIKEKMNPYQSDYQSVYSY